MKGQLHTCLLGRRTSIALMAAVVVLTSTTQTSTPLFVGAADDWQKKWHQERHAHEVCADDLEGTKQELQTAVDERNRCFTNLESEHQNKGWKKECAVQCDVRVNECKAKTKDVQTLLDGERHEHGDCLKNLTKTQAHHDQCQAELIERTSAINDAWDSKYELQIKEKEETQHQLDECERNINLIMKPQLVKAQNDTKRCLKDKQRMMELTNQTQAEDDEEEDEKGSLLTTKVKDLVLGGTAAGSDEECQNNLAIAQEMELECRGELAVAEDENIECHVALSECYNKTSICHGDLSRTELYQMYEQHAKCQEDLADLLLNKTREHDQVFKTRIEEQITNCNAEVDFYKLKFKETEYGKKHLQEFKSLIEDKEDKDVPTTAQDSAEDDEDNSTKEAVDDSAIQDLKDIIVELKQKLTEATKRAEDAEKRADGCTSQEKEEQDQLQELSTVDYELRKQAEAEYEVLTDAMNGKKECEAKLAAALGAAVVKTPLATIVQAATSTTTAATSPTTTTTTTPGVGSVDSLPTSPTKTTSTVSAATNSTGTCNLVMIKSLESPEKGITHDLNGGFIRTISNHPKPKSFWFYIKPCNAAAGAGATACGGDQCISLESYDYTGEFLRHDWIDDTKNLITLERFEDSDEYKADSSFCLRPALYQDAGTDKEADFSFEAINYPENYIYFKRNGKLRLSRIATDADDTKAELAASYIIEYLPCPADGKDGDDDDTSSRLLLRRQLLRKA